MMEKYLPIGSVVLLKNAEKRLMIYGYNQVDTGIPDNSKMFDYVGCLYPEGNIDIAHTYLFNHEHIERIYFLGFQDEEALKFNEYLNEEVN